MWYTVLYVTAIDCYCMFYRLSSDYSIAVPKLFFSHVQLSAELTDATCHVLNVCFQINLTLLIT